MQITNYFLPKTEKLPELTSPLQHSALVQSLHQQYQKSWKQALHTRYKIQEIDSRLYQIDPKCVGKNRAGSPFKYLVRRLSKSEEIEKLKNLRSLNKKIEEQHEQQMRKLEKKLRKFVHSDPAASPSLWKTIKKLPAQSYHFALQTVQYPLSFFKFFYPSPIATPPLPPVSSSHEQKRRMILNLIGGMPIFKENPALQALLEREFQVPEEIEVTLKNPSTMEIRCAKRKIVVDGEKEVSQEEAIQLDPENPLIAKGTQIKVKDLKQIGTIDPSWWEWLKTQRFPSIGPVLRIKQQGNSILFLKGFSLLDAIQFEEKSIVFKTAAWLQKRCDWRIEDCLAFMTKFKSIPI